MTKQILRKQLFNERVAKEWSEQETNDGYWMLLRDGWTLDGASAVHEDTRQKCMSRLCECDPPP